MPTRSDALRDTLDTLSLASDTQQDRHYLVTVLRRLGYTETEIARHFGEDLPATSEDLGAMADEGRLIEVEYLGGHEVQEYEPVYRASGAEATTFSLGEGDDVVSFSAEGDDVEVLEDLAELGEDDDPDQWADDWGDYEGPKEEIIDPDDPDLIEFIDRGPQVDFIDRDAEVQGAVAPQAGTPSADDSTGGSGEGGEDSGAWPEESAPDEWHQQEAAEELAAWESNDSEWPEDESAEEAAVWEQAAAEATETEPGGWDDAGWPESNDEDEAPSSEEAQAGAQASGGWDDGGWDEAGPDETGPDEGGDVWGEAEGADRFDASEEPAEESPTLDAAQEPTDPITNTSFSFDSPSETEATSDAAREQQAWEVAEDAPQRVRVKVVKAANREEALARAREQGLRPVQAIPVQIQSHPAGETSAPTPAPAATAWAEHEEDSAWADEAPDASETASADAGEPFLYEGYTLHSREVELSAGRNQRIYFFAKSRPKSGEPCALPDGYRVKKNQRTGLPYLTREG